MRVLLVSDFFSPVLGGLEGHVGDLSKMLSRLGHEVHVATLTQNANPEISNVTVHNVHSSTSLVVRYEDADRPFHPPIPDPQAHRALSRLVKEVEPDVIHGHSWLCVSLPKSAMRRLVYTLHDYSLICQLRTLFKPDQSNCDGPSRAACASCTSSTTGYVRRHMLLNGTILGRKLLTPAVFVAVSERVHATVSPYVSSPVEIVPNFIMPPPSDEAEPLRGEAYAIYAGDPGDHKGVGALITIWDSPDPPKIPLLVASTRGITDLMPAGVSVTRLKRSDTLEAIRHAQFTVVPSRWEDPCPTVALESLMLGRPVIGFAVGGLKDVVESGVTGFLVPPGGYAELRQKIDLLASNPSIVARMSQNALQASRSYSAVSVVPKLVDIYRRVIARVGAQI